MTGNRVQVIIEGRPVKLVGVESEEYIKMVADYVNARFLEIKKSTETGGATSGSMVSILTAINIADDYFKEKDKTAPLEKEMMKLKKRNLELETNLLEMDKIKSENKGLCAEMERQQAMARSNEESLNAKMDEMKKAMQAKVRELEERLALEIRTTEKQSNDIKNVLSEKRKLEKTVESLNEKLKLPPDKIAGGFRASKKYT